MKRYDDYLFISDLDGTLIKTDKTISQRNKQAIRDFVSQGGHFAIATGRAPQGIAYYLQGLSINEFCILYNGGAIYDFNKAEILSCEFLDKDKLGYDIKGILEQYDTLGVLIFTEEAVCIVSTNQIINSAILEEKPEFTCTSIDAIIHKEWLKIIFIGVHDELLQCSQQLKDKIDTNVFRMVFSGSDTLEILPYGVSKGAALKELIEITGSHNRKVIAIGDYDNDIEMLKIATVGIATANASEGAKQSADLLTVSNDEDAIFEVITHILPNI